MRILLKYFATAVFSIFVGSQITEGILLVPYWQSLSSTEFYEYYNEIGPSIGRFYTVLTIIAALIPISIAIYAKSIDSHAFRYALISSFFAALFVSSFFIYFKDVNELFYQASLSESELRSELITWSRWHWGRIVIELLSLYYLILAMTKLKVNKD